MKKQMVTLNAAQRLYIIPCGGGYSCYGFDVLFEKLKKLNSWLFARGYEVDSPEETLRGTMELYHEWEANIAIAAKHCQTYEVRCDIELTKSLDGLEGSVVDVVDKWGEKRSFMVGKSTGWMPCHLEIEFRGRRESGGAVAGAPFRSLKVRGINRLTRSL